jgi:bifunctional non-homologous end joining protein LigD
MEPVSLPHVHQEKGFIHQIKWDGIRGLAVIEDGGLRVFNKSGIESTARYPELANLTRSVDAQQAVLDGEIVVIVDGTPSFYHVLRRSLSKNASNAASLSVRYIVFDLLFLNRRDLRGLPLEERQDLLRGCFQNSAVAAQADSFEDGEALFQLMEQRSMEGIVSKRPSSRYIAGKRHADWFKTKVLRSLLCAVTGVNYKNGLPASLSLGVYRDGTLTPVGDVGSGLKQEDLHLLAKQLAPGDAPRITCRVRFSEWTPSGTMRHPVFLGFSGAAPAEASGEEQSL